MTVLVDFETYSEVDLKAKPSPGVWAYAEHPSTEVLCLGYKIDDGPVQMWKPPEPFPPELVAEINQGATFEAHNAQFERAIWKNLLYNQTTTCFYGTKYKLGPDPLPMPRRWRDTMAVCAYRSLPLALDHVGALLDLGEKKSREGTDIIRKLCKPRRPTKTDPDTRLSLANAEQAGLFQKLYDYCAQDVTAEHELSRVLGWLPHDEAQVWGLDQTINQRGVAVDMRSVKATRKVATELQERMTAELCALVGDPEMTGKRVAKFLEWLAEHGATLPNMQKETVETWLQQVDRAEHPQVYRALELRQQLSISSVAKLDAINGAVSRDGRVRGTIQYHAGGTGRFGGRLVQPQNLPRPTVTNGGGKLDMDLLHRHLCEYDFDSMDLLYGDVAGALTSSLRGMIVAPPGKRLYVSDFSAIEARVTMWLAGQKDKIEAFYAYDRGEGQDIYCVAAQDLYNKPINKKDHPQERQLGKIQVLGCGYQMSGVKLKDTAAKQGVPISEETAEWLVRTYRESNYMVPRLWYGLQDAAIAAISTGKVVEWQGIEYATRKDAAGPWLTCKLPSGRLLWYFDPKLVQEDDWNGRPRWKITYQGRNNKRQGLWSVVRTYGGMLTENVVQAIARCLLVSAMFRVEDAGYPIVMHIHDEVVSETDDSYGSIKEYDALVAGPNPQWAATIPVASEGWTGHRYRKG